MLFSGNYNENKSVRPTCIQASNLLFCIEDGKATLQRTFCILIQLSGKSWVERLCDKDWLLTVMYLLDSRTSTVCQISLRVNRTFPTALAVFSSDKCTLFSILLPNNRLLNPLMVNDAFKRHNGSTYLKKDNSFRKRSKCVKITRCVEQTLEKNPRFFGAPPALKCTHGGPSRQGLKGHSPLPHCSACMASAWA